MIIAEAPRAVEIRAAVASWPCGHARTAENTRQLGKAGVRCRQCRIAIDANSRARRKAAAATGARTLPETAPEIGHNSAGAEPKPRRGTATDDRLRLLLERIERLEEEKKGIADDIRDAFAELKAVGYDAKIARQILRLRKMDPDARREEEMLLDTYKCALGLD